mmetsp:Transcript_10024/g.19324  ORF Transcript_10024/g.19324 Transcript_10024/m.19324 type:complete len:438 (+) Transcript_10024:101-1414(+)
MALVATTASGTTGLRDDIPMPVGPVKEAWPEQGHDENAPQNQLPSAPSLGRCASSAKLPPARPGPPALQPQLPGLALFGCDGGACGWVEASLVEAADAGPCQAELVELTAAGAYAPMRRSPLGEITNVGASSVPCCLAVIGQPEEAKKHQFAARIPDGLPEPRLVEEYALDILSSMRSREARFVPKPCYVQQHAHVSARMRSTLIDWLFEVHKQYGFQEETFFLTVNIFDRYLAQTNVSRERLQLVGVTSLLLAAKFEEVDPPELADLVFDSVNSYSKHDITNLEMTMLTALQFQVAGPTAAHFLRHYQTIVKQWETSGPVSLQQSVPTWSAVSAAQGAEPLEEQVREDLAWYMLELALLDIHMIGYLPSLLAAAVVLLSRKLSYHQQAWPVMLVQLTGYTEVELEPCTKELIQLLEEAPHSLLQAIRSQHLSAQAL